jgi:predicted nucleic acid-binding protein
MPEKVFANTSVIQYLHCLDLISILKKLFGEIYIPLEVKEELDNGIKQGENLPYLDELDFVNVINVKANSLTKIVRDLGKGETSVILLGMENSNSLLILDDRLAKEVARNLDLRVTGTVGILILAKENGIIKAIKPYLDKLSDIGFYLSKEHRNLILKKADEAD